MAFLHHWADDEENPYDHMYDNQMHENNTTVDSANKLTTNEDINTTPIEEYI